MMNPFREVNWSPGPRECRHFARSLTIGFPCVAVVLLLAGRWHGAGWNFRLALALGAGGALLGLILWLVPQIVRPFYVIWYALACCAGFVVGNVVLVAVYLLMMTPIGLAIRALGRSGLSKRFDRSARTYWRDAQPRGDVERYYRQF